MSEISGGLAPVLERMLGQMREYIDAQDSETREVTEGQIQKIDEQFAEALMQVLARLGDAERRLADLEVYNGSGKYRAWLVSEMKRTASADLPG